MADPTERRLKSMKGGRAVAVTLPGSNMEMEHRPLKDNCPLQGGPGQLP